MRRAWLGGALAAAVVALAGSVALTIAYGPWNHPGAVRGTMMSGAVRGGNPGMMGGQVPGGNAGMMGGAVRGGNVGMMGGVWLAGDGAKVTSIAAARARATTAAAQAGLHPGEIIWFDNGFYVELKDASGASATEVIVNVSNGVVSTEPGPAMMWNTRYGMRHAGTGAGTGGVSATQAQQIATTWVTANLPGRRVDPPDAYPGYYTMETTTAQGTINGMLSVNAATGQVWYHTWHGTFIAREDS